MRRLSPWFLLALLLLPALQPYLAGDFPRTNDAATHLYRAFELDRLLRAGVFFPRWGPDFAHGYGYPTFHYFPYLSHYLIEAGRLAGLPLLWGMRLAFALALAGAGAAAFALARDLFEGSEAAGLTAAAAYVYSPYVLYTANVRGGLPENVMLALLPLALLALRRLAAGHWRWLPVGALAVAGMTFSHLGGLVQVSPFVALFALACLLDNGYWAKRSGLKPQVSRLKEIQPPTVHSAEHENGLRFTHYVLRISPLALLVAATLLLGLALPAFQWLPARAELGEVRFAEGFSGAGIVYSLNFATLADLFALPRLPVDLDLLNPPVARPLPFVAVALALVALARWQAFSPQSRRFVFFFGFVFFAAVFLSLDWSRFLWDRVSLLQQTLWPWRYLAPATLAAAILAGGAVGKEQGGGGAGEQGSKAQGKQAIASTDRELGKRITGYALRVTLYPQLLLLALLLTALPWLYPPREPLPVAPTLADLARVEIPPLLVGTTTTGEYTPVAVQTWPDTNAMRQEQAAGRDPERLDPASLPAGATFAVTQRNPLAVTYLLNLPAEAEAVYRTFYFPGWRAELDGRPLALRATQPEGLISFQIPAGQHVVSLQFADTPVRRLGNLISRWALAAFTLVALAVVAAVIRSLLAARPSRLSPPAWPPPSYGHLHLRCAHAQVQVLRITFYAFLLLLVKLALLDPGLTPLVRHGLRGGALAEVSHPLGTDFGGELTLLGYDVSREAVAAGDSFSLNLYWRAQRPLGVPYGFGARLVDGRGLAWSGTDIQRPRDFRFFPGTDNWPPNQFILDPYIIAPMLGTPPGVYDLEVVAYRQSDLLAIGTARLGPVTITAPSQLPAQAGPPEAAFGNGLALFSHGLDRAAAAPGDPVRVTLTWLAEGTPGADLQARLDLVTGTTGSAAFTHEFTIVEGYPTGRWGAGQVLADQILLRLPAALETGSYTWQLTVLNADGTPAAPPAPLSASEAPSSTAFQVTAPPRTFELPKVAHPLDVALGEAVRLRGYNLSAEAARPGNSVTVSLVWQALREMPVSYNVFLHLIDPATETIVAQSDGAPAGWTRPTTGWVTGEVVVDERVLNLPPDLPAGDYALWVGLVDPATNERLPVAGAAADRIQLGTLAVAP